MTQEAKTERRRLVARRVFEALCAQYPEKYIALVQPGDATDQRIVRDHGAKSRPTATNYCLTSWLQSWVGDPG